MPVEFSLPGFDKDKTEFNIELMENLGKTFPPGGARLSDGQGSSFGGNDKTLIIICGVPLSGKTSIAKKVAEELGVKHLDVDTDIRFPIFGKPEQGADLTPEGKEQERVEMLASYKVMLSATNELLTLGRSVILTATFSREVYWELTNAVMAKHSDVKLRVIQCKIADDSDEEIWRRIRERGVHTVNSPAQYREVKNRYIKLPVEHLEVDTTGPDNLVEKVSRIVKYVLG